MMETILMMMTFHATHSSAHIYTFRVGWIWIWIWVKEGLL